MEIRADMRIISDKDLFAIGTVTLGGILRIQNVKVDAAAGRRSAAHDRSAAT